jgi:uncharacterized protein
MTAPRTLSLLVAFLLALAAPAFGQSKEELQARFKQRDAQLVQLKSEGRIGETMQGLVAATRPAFASDAKVKAFVEEENKDRLALYVILSKEQTDASGGKTKVTPSMVATVNANRSFSKAKSGEWLQVADDTWIQKKDEPRYRLLEKLKRDGKVGETTSGFLEAVKPEYLEDATLKRALDEERAFRRQRYEETARDDRSTADKVASQRGEKLVARAASGEYVKDASGWRKK